MSVSKDLQQFKHKHEVLQTQMTRNRGGKKTCFYCGKSDGPALQNTREHSEIINTPSSHGKSNE